MGLLDDAIREHLELKRLRGADPGAVAREEQDALGEVPRKGSTEPGGELDGEESARIEAGSPSPVPTSDIPDGGGQETIEINMEAELVSEGDPGEDASQAKGAKPVAHAARTERALTEDSLEWEVPRDRSDPSAESKSEPDARPDNHGAVEHAEDVLEETPDFLRDTPEQERLWFEQRPPRDFDFNE
jgi:hypothetical protein